VQARWPKERRPLLDAAPEIEALALEYRDCRARLAEFEAHRDALEVALKTAIGEHVGIRGRFGEITWKATKDALITDWRALVESLALPSDTIHRFTTLRPGARRMLARWASED
jgi:hypothetical protein